MLNIDNYYKEKLKKLNHQQFLVHFTIDGVAFVDILYAKYLRLLKTVSSFVRIGFHLQYTFLVAATK